MNPNPQSGFSDSNFPSISLINRLLSLLLFAILLQTITCRIFAKTNPDQVNQALGIPLFPNDTPASIWESPP
ncbi:MAG: hypothetical protein NZL93_04400, partial [Chthoniobacterales bacterium]|nr:hypothetical protein [Chthoniobacterales bacterium]